MSGNTVVFKNDLRNFSGNATKIDTRDQYVQSSPTTAHLSDGVFDV
jgi:hypothetical protein